MSDNQSFDLFLDAIESFPPEHRQAATEWLTNAQAALSLVDEIKRDGLSAIFGGDK